MPIDIRPLTDTLSVSQQITAADLQAARNAGFQSVICNRPDGEGADQSNFREVERAALTAGLQARYLPAESGKVSDERGVAFGVLMAELPKPVLAFCRTGVRSATCCSRTAVCAASPSARAVFVRRRCVSVARTRSAGLLDIGRAHTPVTGSRRSRPTSGPRSSFRFGCSSAGHVKVRNRGLAKTTAQLHTLFALVSLWLVCRKLMASAA